MAGKRVVTFHEASGFNFRLLMKDGGYRDFNAGVLSTDEDDPYLDELIEWAKKKPNISMVDSGKQVKDAIEVCPVCKKPLDTELDEHMALVHVDEDGIRESVGLPAREAKTPTRRRRG